MKTLQPRPGVITRHLSRLPVFEGLSAQHLDELAGQAMLRLYERGDYLFHQGRPADAMNCLVNGAVRVYRRVPDGREKVIHLLQAPSMVAEVAVLTGKRFPASAACSEHCTVVVIPRRALVALFKTDQELAMRMLGAAMARLRELTNSLAAHGQKSSVTRVASYLLGLAHTQGDSVVLPAAKKDVACFLGLQPESFSRALASLRKKGVITVEKHCIELVDRDSMESLLADF